MQVVGHQRWGQTSTKRACVRPTRRRTIRKPSPSGSRRSEFGPFEFHGFRNQSVVVLPESKVAHGIDRDTVGFMPGPHDLLFRLTFSRPKLAADQVRAVLPEALTRHLDLAKMRVLPSTFVQAELREFISDVLYEVPLADGRPAQIWLLFEHQSKADPWILLRSLRYMLEAWWAAVIPRSKSAKTITPIIPILIHHEQDWVVPRRFSELYEPLPGALSAAVRPWLVDFGIEVDDLTAQSETNSRRARPRRCSRRPSGRSEAAAGPGGGPAKCPSGFSYLNALRKSAWTT